ncbi:phosphotransferase [Paraferrimonas haliotis]|uniref:Phosphotransferase n=1 Tax=Paraferrimonas haliotis TaxID=2013866 RepID=A0AA37TUQ9_9GAMM|nr:phosphotransferase [Paraferrimonas haliotis]GLS82121.1 phosphotransferase [Paraferrimonas haliotis]
MLVAAHQQALLELTQARSISDISTLQSLWSGYGALLRVRLDGATLPSVIVKQVNWQQLPQQLPQHPRGWSSQRSHQRKLTSYQIETHWYQQFAALTDNHCPVPQCLLAQSSPEQLLLVLEDLNNLGFSQVISDAELVHVLAVIEWLASFHAKFFNNSGEGLWTQGSYWHLATRPDEHQAMADSPLKQHAQAIANTLIQSPYQTLIHGDAKLANFCFTPSGTRAAAVDFQYVGQGVGVVDLAYFISSVLNDEQCEALEALILEHYFTTFGQRLKHYHPQLSPTPIEANWRALYCFAWADFCRFLKGWSPDHWKLSGYSERQTAQALAQIAG